MLILDQMLNIFLKLIIVFCVVPLTIWNLHNLLGPGPIILPLGMEARGYYVDGEPRARSFHEEC